MRNHAYKDTWWRRLGWRFVAWVLFWLLVLSLLINLHMLFYVARMP